MDARIYLIGLFIFIIFLFIINIKKLLTVIFLIAIVLGVVYLNSKHADKFREFIAFIKGDSVREANVKK